MTPAELKQARQAAGLTQEEKDMTVRFNTAEYVFSHGKEPKGRGAWWFQFDTENTYFDDSAWTPGGPMSYTDAKCVATEKARRVGCTVVRVLP